MINGVTDDDLRDAVFGRLLEVLDRFDQAKVWYRLGYRRPEIGHVEVAPPRGQISNPSQCLACSSHIPHATVAVRSTGGRWKECCSACLIS